MSNFLDSFPYPSPRPIQAEALRALHEIWNDYEVFVVSAPTAFGKSAVARTLMTALRSVSVITPTNQLVDQFLEEFPGTPSLHRLDSYWCEKWSRPCPVTRGKLLQFCSEKRDGCKCQASGDLSTAKYRKGPGIYNYYTYLSHKLYRDTLVVDEAHNLLPTIRDRLALTIWQHDVGYPSSCYSPDQIRVWIGGLSDKKRRSKKIQLLREAVSSGAPSYMYMRTTDMFGGKGTTRGIPEERDCIRLTPVDVSDAAPMFWPAEVKKIVLLSATIGPKDIEQLGLNRKRVAYVDCASPIPAENRPIIPLNIAAVNKSNVEETTPILVEEIRKIAEHHRGEKGIIHATYDLASRIRNQISDPRFIFHDRYDKADRYRQFRNATNDAVLVASGLYEGIDLAEDFGRWQVITKIPWGNLGNPAVKYQSERDPESYLWDTIRIVIQACGRICRTPTDFGCTYLLDSTFERMYNQGSHLLPSWWTDALHSWRAK